MKSLLGCFAGMTLLSAPPVIRMDKPMAPPEWALAQRALLKAYAEAAGEFAAKYVDERGYFECVERWGGNEGPASEAVYGGAIAVNTGCEGRDVLQGVCDVVRLGTHGGRAGGVSPLRAFGARGWGVCAEGAAVRGTLQGSAILRFQPSDCAEFAAWEQGADFDGGDGIRLGR